MSKSEYDLRIKYVQGILKIAEKSPRDAVVRTISGIVAKAEQTKFALVDIYENDVSRDLELWKETDPLLTVDIYTREMRRMLLELETILYLRANEIREMRKVWKKEHPNWRPY